MQQLDQVTYEQIIMIGDFNGTIDDQLDRKVKKTKEMEGKLQKVFFFKKN